MDRRSDGSNRWRAERANHEPQQEPEACCRGETPTPAPLWLVEQERGMRSLHALAASAVLAAASLTPACAADMSGAGATYPYPIYSKWAAAYKKVPGVGLIYQSIGWGGDIKQIQAKTVAFGATDLPLKGAELDKDG